MTARDRLLALLVVLCWGMNFPATALALRHFPPMLMVALRFVLVAVPALLFIPRPVAKWRWLVGTGLGIGLLQFAFLYAGMAAGMPSGLASLVLQASAPFTVVLAGVFLREKLSRRQVIGIVVAVGGLGAIAVHRAQVAALLPTVLTLCGAFGWAIGNICSRQAARENPALNPFHLTMWMSVVPVLPMLVMSFVFEGADRIGRSLSTMFTADALPAVLGLAYIVVIATLLGYGIWNTLMSRYPSSLVAPFSMLVPVAGVLSSWLMFDEALDLVELLAGLVVVGGVLIASRMQRGTSPARPTVGPAESAEPEVPDQSSGRTSPAVKA